MSGSPPQNMAAADATSNATTNATTTHTAPMFQQQLLQLRQQQELQQQMLLQRFQVQQQQLTQKHQQQLQQHIKQAWIQQVQQQLMTSSRDGHVTNVCSSGDIDMSCKEDLEVDCGGDLMVSGGGRSEATDQTPLQQNRPKHQQSAVASSEVKQRLQKFVLEKRQREAAAADWTLRAGSSGGASSSGSYRSHTGGGVLPAASGGATTRTEAEYCPLRKTASEPNIDLRARLKTRVLERWYPNCSSASRHRTPHHDRLGPIKGKKILAMDSGSLSTPESDIGSPTSSSANHVSRTALSKSSTIHEESGALNLRGASDTLATSGGVVYTTGSSSLWSAAPWQGSTMSQLYSSPSMPNISLGRPALSTNTAALLGGVDADNARASYVPLVPLATPFLPPLYPVVPVMEGECTPPTSPAYTHRQMRYLEEVSRSASLSVAASQQLLAAAAAAVSSPSASCHQLPLMPAFSSLSSYPLLEQMSGARSASYRPLNRTHSAPLPLGHPVLQGAAISRPQAELNAVHDRTLSAQQQQQQHTLLKQHIRQSVLSRTNSKCHVENVEEETEAAVAREMMQDSQTLSSTSSPSHDLSGHSVTASTVAIDLTDGRGSRDSPRDLSSDCATDLSSSRLLDSIRRVQTERNMSLRGGRFIGAGGASCVRPLARARSSPLVTLSEDNGHSTLSANRLTFNSEQGDGTGLVYDPVMLKHQCTCGDNSRHLEHSGRLQSLWARLQHAQLVVQCRRIGARKASLQELETCHSHAHAVFFGTDLMSQCHKPELASLSAEMALRSFVTLPCGGVGVDLDTTWNESHTSAAARMAVGCVIELSGQVAAGRLRNGLALVRPPGHHAEHQQAMGFCYFNSVAVAGRLLKLNMNAEKVLIADWDVHHGNGTQQMFYHSSHVLYVSLHRHDGGNFFPGTGSSEECGAEDGMGFNVNIAWSGGDVMSDAEYMAAFRTIVMPIARDYEPEVVLVSCGFDAAEGHSASLGGYSVSAACFGWMTRQLMTLANGKVVLALEGGYHVPSICDAAEQCVRSLLDNGSACEMSSSELTRTPNTSALTTLLETISIQSPHWPCVKRTAHLINMSHAQALKDPSLEATRAMAELSMQQQQQQQQQQRHGDVTGERGQNVCADSEQVNVMSGTACETINTAHTDHRSIEEDDARSVDDKMDDS